MSFEFISTLSESRLVPAETMMRRWRADELAEVVVLYVCALYVLHCHTDTEHFATGYAKKTVQFGTNFEQWKSGGSDLYVMLYGLKASGVTLRDQVFSDEFKHRLPFGEPLLVKWLRDLSNGRVQDVTHRALFNRLDFNFKITSSSIRAVRRLVMDWPELDKEERKLAMTRLLQLIKNRAPKSELLSQLRQLADRHNLEIEDVCDADTGDNCNALSARDVAIANMNKKKGGPSKTGTFLAALAGVATGVAVSKALDKK